MILSLDILDKSKDLNLFIWALDDMEIKFSTSFFHSLVFALLHFLEKLIYSAKIHTHPWDDVNICQSMKKTFFNVFVSQCSKNFPHISMNGCFPRVCLYLKYTLKYFSTPISKYLCLVYTHPTPPFVRTCISLSRTSWIFCCEYNPMGELNCLFTNLGGWAILKLCCPLIIHYFLSNLPQLCREDIHLRLQFYQKLILWITNCYEVNSVFQPNQGSKSLFPNFFLIYVGPTELFLR